MRNWTTQILAPGLVLVVEACKLPYLGESPKYTKWYRSECQIPVGK